MFVMEPLQPPVAQHAGVGVWLLRIDLGAALDAPVFSTLCDAERERAARFLRREDALRYATTRAALRELLSRRVGAPAAQLQFVRDGRGRPRLAAPAAIFPALDFNVAHSGAYALIAVSSGRRVGVDIEAHRSDLDWRSLADMVFTPREKEFVASLPQAQSSEAFYAAWTAKEALLKAWGLGLSGGMTGFSVLDTESEALLRVSAPAAVAGATPDLHLAWCDAPAGYSASLAWSCH